MSLLVPASVPVRAPALERRVTDWGGAQGADWARRNPQSVAELDASYLEKFRITRTAVNERMLARVPRTARILEVGCSGGNQLDALHAGGFTSLEGCDLSTDALAKCRWPAKVADGSDLPYEDSSFDLVMTSGTFMHVPPGRKVGFLAEIKRVSSRWYYGCEMWTSTPMAWDFANLIPPAWTCDWFAALADPAWPIVERALLEPTEPFARPLAVWLMEKTG